MSEDVFAMLSNLCVCDVDLQPQLNNVVILFTIGKTGFCLKTEKKTLKRFKRMNSEINLNEQMKKMTPEVD